MTKESWPKDYIHKEHPKTRPADDFWGQVSRTVGGRPVGQEQIDMIVVAVRSGLHLDPQLDVLLDLGAGNGALSRYFFADCRRFLGVDFSPYLVQIARQNFEREPDYRFLESDAVAYVESEAHPQAFTKVLCYGAFSYFSPTDAHRLLRVLGERFGNVKLLYIGNLPDKDRAHLFYPAGKDFRSLLDDCSTPIGVWRSQREFAALAAAAGWQAEFRQMPRAFYAAHYRYDAILRRPETRSVRQR